MIEKIQGLTCTPETRLQSIQSRFRSEASGMVFCLAHMVLVTCGQADMQCNTID
jgi:hypothetical protein